MGGGRDEEAATKKKSMGKEKKVYRIKNKSHWSIYRRTTTLNGDYEAVGGGDYWRVKGHGVSWSEGGYRANELG